jgi:hypothetical protein
MKSTLIKLILALVVCASALVGYWVWYGVVATASVAVTTLQNQIDTKTSIVSRTATTRSALADIADDEDAVQNYFISETGVVAFINSLEALGRASGAATVSVLSVSAGNALPQPTFTFTLSIKGTFDAVMRTVGAIEYAPYAISISSLSVGRDAKNEWHADLAFTVGSSAISTP